MSRRRNTGFTPSPPPVKQEPYEPPAREALDALRNFVPAHLNEADARVWLSLSPYRRGGQITRDDWANLSGTERQARREHQAYLDRTRSYREAVARSSRGGVAAGTHFAVLRP